MQSLKGLNVTKGSFCKSGGKELEHRMVVPSVGLLTVEIEGKGKGKAVWRWDVCDHMGQQIAKVGRGAHRSHRRFVRCRGEESHVWECHRSHCGWSDQPACECMITTWSRKLGSSLWYRSFFTWGKFSKKESKGPLRVLLKSPYIFFLTSHLKPLWINLIYNCFYQLLPISM